MRLVKNKIELNGSGTVTLCPEEPEDMWHAYNLIRPGDLLRASAIRRVTTTQETGSTSSARVHLNLEIRVKSLDFDPQSSQLHVSGQIVNETAHTKVGQHHTLDLELNRNFTLEKEIGSDGEGVGWDSIAVQMLKDAVDEGGNRRAEAVAVVMQEGLAHICFIGQFQTILKQKVEMSVPRKRHGGGDHDKGMNKFFQVTLDTLVRQMEFNTSATALSTSNETVRPVLLASPGFVAAGFQKYIQSVASTSMPALKRLLPSIVVVHSASGYLHSLAEVLQSPAVKTILADTKYARETKLMDDFLDQLRKETNKATYGPREVESAVDQGAVGRGGGVLIISNRLFRSQDVAERKRWVSLVDRVRDVEGGEVRVLSSDHESGRRLDGLGGVAALLTFPIVDDAGEDEDEDDSQ
ncbi:putative translation factor pelota [Aspergillus uvarum CBS 121591]|uniref:Protein DOM34 homolog n=4 Tax=Aspergillus TaxID=5052 RepID=A0A319CDZ4_9EURO|nr:putative translation factor pelota [Aspergillus uvarum CBS 121591]XP_025524572.1 putative translation factor pelota [Aspergillus japonicus CBS 114.51]PYI18274.1 putative translation factor pelota [Aspergillus violaceofuscus CBS 115571]PYI24940.1 putative translation factor pelota [Aspergillus indologenus CBS 114.80]PYH84036.1 putative translation factor pelota [Aspergillus uvarum CBS 121591]RAH78678.1 putative translation factor pelota [Aspergillus japonicus CBS 114.51]